MNITYDIIKPQENRFHTTHPPPKPISHTFFTRAKPVSFQWFDGCSRKMPLPKLANSRQASRAMCISFSLKRKTTKIGTGIGPSFVKSCCWS